MQVHAEAPSAPMLHPARPLPWVVLGCVALAGASWWAGPQLVESANSLFGTTQEAAPAQPAAKADARGPEMVLPTSDPAALKPLTPEQAIALNAAMALSTEPNPAASPMALVMAGGVNLMRSIDCLTAAVYYEAANEPIAGQEAVAQVVLNRSRHPAFPHSVCGVVFQGSTRTTGCQFTFTCDGSLARTPSRTGWARARLVAERALSGAVYAPVGWATHYHADYVVPYWASSLAKVMSVGHHIFYRWAGGWGKPGAFNASYAGEEPAVFADAAEAEIAKGIATIDAREPGSITPLAERPVLDNSGAVHAAPLAEALKPGEIAKPGEAPRGARPNFSTAGARWVIGDPAPAPKANMVREVLPVVNAAEPVRESATHSTPR